MALCEVRRSPLLFCSRRKPFIPFVCHHIKTARASKAAIPMKIQEHLSRSERIYPRKGDAAAPCTGLCKLFWTVEADIADGYLLFLVGEPVSLGCWEPDMAILLSPSKESNKLWEMEIKVPCGINFKYNYFMRDEKQFFADLIWRPGPEFSLSVPSNCREDEVTLVRDSWIRTRTERSPLPPWCSWMLDLKLTVNSQDNEVYQAPDSGEHEMLKSSNGIPFQENKLLMNSMAKDGSSSTEYDVRVGDSGQDMSEMDQPVEEPWLLRSTFDSLIHFSEVEQAPYHDKEQSADLPQRLQGNMEKLPLGDDWKVTHNEEPASIVILINSSVCTMQRIAVLEDRKLVELLLEPVKNNVQCDNVYLGVVTKLVPHMGGSFVDIGISRPSLMEIKPNREPFVYPPFNQIKKGILDGSAEVDPMVQLGTHIQHSEGRSYDEDDIIDDFSENDQQDESIEHLQENLEDTEVVDDMDISDAFRLTEHGSINHNEADLEELLKENEHHLEDESFDDALDQENLVDSDLAQLLHEELHSFDDRSNTENKWTHVRKGTKVVVQVVKEGLGTKGPALTAYPNLKSRFWILSTRCDRIGVSKKITGVERARLRVIAKSLKPPGFGLTVRTVAAGHSLEELQKDLEGLVSTWKGIVENAKSAALASDEGVEGAIPVMLHRAMGQTLSVVQDYFNEKVNKMVVDSPRTYHEVTSYLQDIAPDLCDRVELYDKRTPIFDDYGIEEEINNILSKRVSLPNGGSLVIEQTEALVSVDVNGGHGMLGQSTSQEKAVLEVNRAAAKQIAHELRLRDIGGIIVVDFIDMVDESNRRLVYEEMKKAVERDRSMVKVSELSKYGLMEITRKRVRPSVTFMISEPCTCCHATGRVEALETSFSKIEHEICRLLAGLNDTPNPENVKSWPRFVLKVDRHMCNYLTSGKRTKLAVLSSSLKVWILLKVARGFSRGQFEVKPFADEKGNDVQRVTMSRLQPTEARPYFPNSKLTVFPIKKWKSRGK